MTLEVPGDRHFNDRLFRAESRHCPVTAGWMAQRATPALAAPCIPTLSRIAAGRVVAYSRASAETSSAASPGPPRSFPVTSRATPS
jgi:hypothetical protein